MGEVGFEPTRISTLDLETNSFNGCAPRGAGTARTSTHTNVQCGFWFQIFVKKNLGGVGFEPTRIAPLDLKTNSFCVCAL